MLNRELLLYRRNSGRIIPRFLESDGGTVTLCQTLLDIYREAARRQFTRAVLEENLEPFIKGSAGGKIAAALNKVLLDHVEFNSAVNAENMPQQREMIFKQAASLLQKPPENADVYRRKVLAAVPGNYPDSWDIYSDLPEFDRLIKVPEWSAAEYCNLYNIAQVQGLLLYAEKLELTLSDPDAMTLRKFMRRLKFYRLLAEVKRCSAHDIQLVLSGPSAIFGESRKYALQLAAFFPVILLLQKWKLRAEIKLRDNASADILSLQSGRCDLKSYICRWTVCVPDEVALFVKNFRENAGDWHEAPDVDLPEIANSGTFFPDFSFEKGSGSGKTVHVEIFHRYYSGNTLSERLDFLAQHPEFPLVVGIDRAMLGKNGEEMLKKQFPTWEQHAFFFSNYPGAERVKKMLDRVLELCQHKLL